MFYTFISDNIPANEIPIEEILLDQLPHYTDQESIEFEKRKKILGEYNFYKLDLTGKAKFISRYEIKNNKLVNRKKMLNWVNIKNLLIDCSKRLKGRMR